MLCLPAARVGAFGALSLLALALSQPARSQTFITTDTIIDHNFGSVVIGFASEPDRDNYRNPSSPTVNIVAGGSADPLFIYNNSVLNQTGGGIGELDAYLFSRINVSGGSISSLNVTDTTTTNIGGSAVIGSVNTASGVVNLSGGTVQTGLHLQTGGNINYTGGCVLGNSTLFIGTLNIYGSGLTDSGVVLTTSGAFNYISGTLLDGTLLSNFAVQRTSFAVGGGVFGQINVINSSPVPEPSSFLAVGLLSSGAILARHRPNRRR